VHAVKNPKTALYKACAELHTRLRFGLTGTAMQNNYEELYYMLDMCARRPRRPRDSTKLLLCRVGRPSPC
jgi:SNF2 family DNA or RNA helicase